MKRWKQSAVLTMIVGASFVLLVTVLPQFASGIGLGALANRLTSSSSCSGSSGSSGSSSGVANANFDASSSSGSSSSQCAPATGTVTGTITITGGPNGFDPSFQGVGACPIATPPGQMCANPAYALANDGSYSITLTAGKWDVVGFYELNPYGGAFLGTSKVVFVPGGGTVTRSLVVPYQAPASLKGTIRVTHVPSGIAMEDLSVLLCPSYAPYDGNGYSSIACVSISEYQESGADVGPYSVSGLPPGQWTAYPGYCTEFGCATNAQAGVAVTLTPGGKTTADLSTPFLMPDEGLLTGTVSVLKAPAGFDDSTGVSACQTNANFCYTYSADQNGNFTLLLANGTWKISPFYLVPPFYNAITGHSSYVTISGGKTTTANLAVTYQKLGTAAGTIDVTGAPAHTTIESYTVLACPAATPWTGGLQPVGCINEYSGPGGYGLNASNANGLNKIAHPATAKAAAGKSPFNVYNLPTLTRGPWLLYPGYSTDFASYTSPTGTAVQIVSGTKVTQSLSVAYQQPTLGIVQGTVDAIGAPENDFESGVQACSAPPSGTTCANEQEGFSELNGQYQLELAPGTWWVSGFVQVYGYGPGQQQSNSPPREVSVTAGSRVTENFVVTVGS